MADDLKKNRKTSTTERPPEGHHDAHERPKAPYGGEELMHEEQQKRHDKSPQRGENPRDEAPL